MKEKYENQEGNYEDEVIQKHFSFNIKTILFMVSLAVMVCCIANDLRMKKDIKLANQEKETLILKHKLEMEKKEAEFTDFKCSTEVIIDTIRTQHINHLDKLIETAKKEAQQRYHNSYYIARYIRKFSPTLPEILIGEITESIRRISIEEDIPEELIAAIIQVETGFNPMAISSKNARGLMQVMPFWAKHFDLNEVCDLHNVYTGIETGVKVLKVHLKEQNDNLEKALYYYVNRDKKYVKDVNMAMAKIMFFKHDERKESGTNKTAGNCNK